MEKSDPPLISKFIFKKFLMGRVASSNSKHFL